MRWNELFENQLDDFDSNFDSWLRSQPLNQIWYMGTNQPFEEYDPAQVDKRSLFFSTDKSSAQHYARDRAEKLGGDPIVVEAKLRITNPWYTDETNDYRWDIEDAKQEGCDAVIGPAHSGMHPPLNAVVFSLKQVQQLS